MDTDAREQRRRAVSMLKRAASLPRMEGGRRPRMHPDVVSEGEKPQDGRDDTPDPETPPSEPVEVPDDPPPQPHQDPDPDPDDEPPAVRPASRSRRRSRSRRSKDMKKAPTPTHADSSPELGGVLPLPLAQEVPALPPSPSPFGNLARQRLLRSPTPTPPSAPPTPGLPSLEDITRRNILQRSHSAAGRQSAMNKLTGGTDVYDPSMSPSPTSGLRRNLTVSGDERLATERTIARRQLLDRLNPRIAKDVDVEPNSGEEQPTPPPSEGKRRRRRSKSKRRGSVSNTAISDSDYITTSPNTPIPPTTPVPPENPQAYFAEIRARSTTPNLGFLTSFSPRGPSPIQSPEPYPASPLHSDQDAPIEPHDEHEPSHHEEHAQVGWPGKSRRRSIVVEDEEDDPPMPQYRPNLPSTSPHGTPSNGSPFRLPQSYDVQSTISTESQPGMFNVPFYLSDDTSGQDGNPFQSPAMLRVRREEESRFSRESAPSIYDNDEREISWIAQQVEELDPQDVQDVQLDDDELAEEERPASSRSSLHEDYDLEESSPRASSVLIDSEASPEITPSHVPPSPSSLAALSQSASMTRGSTESIPHSFPQRLSVAERSPLSPDFTDVEDRPESSAKRAGTWQKIKGFARSGSSAGRRSRTNSIGTRERRDHTDSSVSRESGASMHSGRTDKNEGTFSRQQSQHFVTQSPTASASVPALALGSPSPMSPGPASGSNYSRYQTDPKLFPFNAPKQLEKTPSTSDVTSHAKGFSESSIADQPSSFRPPESRMNRQTSDTGMRIKYTNAPPPTIDYFNIPQSAEPKDAELPTTLLDVRKWMRVKTTKKGPSAPTTPELSAKKPSLTELIKIRKATEIVTDRDESSTATVVGSPSSPLLTPEHSVTPSPSLRTGTDVEQTPRANRVLPPSDGSYMPMSPMMGQSSPPDALSPTPEPSSTSEYPAPSVSSSSSTSSSNYSSNAPASSGSLILEKLNENLARSSRSPMWANVVEKPSREFVFSRAVLQVVNPNTVKDRILILFSDLLVIAKPVNGPDSAQFGSAPGPADDKLFIVKSVVKLHDLKFTGDRSEVPAKSANYALPPRNPILRTFIHQFRKHPDHAISTLFSSLNVPDDPTLLGQLLFRTTELDRAQLGEYLARRTSKVVLKNYLDNFGFVGLRVDRAVRAFLFSIHVAPRPASSLEYLLDAFASRWYDANASLVAYDKDLAIRLVRAIVQVNEHLHGGIAQRPGPSEPIRMLQMRNFMEAFRRIDPSRLVSDDTLREVFEGIVRERICMAPSPSSPSDDPSLSPSPMTITVKRRPPEQLTYKVQSEPVHLKLPAPDAHFFIHLYGEGLVFDPPVLSFAKSSEASFRVTGVALGQKTYIMIRSGAHALKYHGLALSSAVTVERAFMRNTFQVAFVNHEGVRRRYMFGIQDPVVKMSWITELQRRCEDSEVGGGGGSGGGGGMQRRAVGAGTRFHRAVDVMAFRALQETLMGPRGDGVGMGGGMGMGVSGVGDKTRARKGNAGGHGHGRSKSRSQVYHRQQEVEMELGLGNGNGNGNGNGGGGDQEGDGDEENHDGQKTWSLAELKLQCQQNSSIGLLLSYLQVGSPGP